MADVLFRLVIGLRSIASQDLGPVHTYPDIFESQRSISNSPVHKYSDSLRIDKIVPPRIGSSRFNPESLRTAMLSYSFKLFLPAVLSGK